MNWKLSLFLGALLGVALTIGVAALAVCIGSAVNGITFSQQICDWANGAKTAAEAAKNVSAIIKF